MSPVTSVEDTLLHSYLFLRRAVGTIGIALPFVLIIGNLVLGGGLLDSISGYYYSDMRGVFVGSMCAVGVFLLSYRGYDRIDDIAGNVAAIGAFGVALFPTRPSEGANTLQFVVGIVHLVSAGVFFCALAFFCLYLFRRTAEESPTERKLRRNGVYLTCGIVIMACLVLIGVTTTLTGHALEFLHPEVWLESGAVWAFGVAWMTKGEAILADITP